MHTNRFYQEEILLEDQIGEVAEKSSLQQRAVKDVRQLDCF